MRADFGIRSERGVSKVIGVVLLIAIVLLLALSAGTMIKATVEQEPEAPSVPAVTFDENRFNVQITAHSAIKNADHLEIKVNGETRRIWDDYSAGTSKTVQCVDTGDDISVVSAGEDQSHTVRNYEVNRRTDCRFEVSVGSSGPSQPVSPIGWQSSSAEFEDFYSYAHSHAHLDPDSSLIEADSSYMFFYEYEGDVALVLVHDLPQKHGTHRPGANDPTDDDHRDIPAVGQPRYDYSGPSDTGGGAVDMVFDGLPSAGSWELKDDPHDWTYTSGVTGEDCTAVPNRVCWSWASQHTDGGIYAGGFEDPDAVDITISANWNDPSVAGDTVGDGNFNRLTGGGKIDDDSWKFLYATEDGIKAIDLDKTEDVHIEGLDTS